MRSATLLLLAALLTTALGGCATVENLVGEDAAAHTNRRFPETRLMRLADWCDGDTLRPGVQNAPAPLSSQDFRRSLDLPFQDRPCATIAPGESFALVVNSIMMPSETRVFSSDIAVVMDVDLGDPSGRPKPVVVWFQKGYRSSSALNLDDLLVAQRTAWPGNTAPRLRFRIVQINDETNKELLATLDGAGSVAQALAVGTGNAALLPVVQTALAAGRLAVAARQNRMLLDFSVQVYPSEVPQSMPALGLSALHTGAYVVVGHARAAPPDLALNVYRNRLEFAGDAGSARYDGPAFLFSIVRGDLALNATVDALSQRYAIRLGNANSAANESRAKLLADLAADARFLGALDRYAAKPGVPQLRGLLAEIRSSTPAQIKEPTDGLKTALDVVLRGTGCQITSPEQARRLSETLASAPPPVNGRLPNVACPS
jgi:hypothetical protein